MDIIAGLRIGDFWLGTNLNQVRSLLSKEFFQESELEDCFIIQTNQLKFWVRKESDIVTQIGVSNGFEGKFLDVIGIGSTLGNIKQLGIQWEDQDYVYVLPNYPGICFELLDEEDWNEENSPIEYIYIYKNIS